MIGFRKHSVWSRLLFALFAAMALHAQFASAKDIPCTSFKDKCRSLTPRLGAGKAGEYTIADKAEIAPGYEAVLLNHRAAHAALYGWGVFIVDSAGKHVLTLETFPEGEASELWVRLGKHSEGSLVVMGYEGHGFEEINTKYFFDLSRRKKLGAIKTGVDVDVRYILEFNGAIYCIGTAISGNMDFMSLESGKEDKAHAIIAIISPPPAGEAPAQSAVPAIAQSHVPATDHLPGQSPAGITILDRIGKQKIERILDARIAGDKLILIGKQHRYTLSNGIWKTSAAPVPALEAQAGTLEPGQPHRGGQLPGHPSWEVSVHDINNTKTHKNYPLPQPSYKLFSQSRRERVGDGYDKDSTTLESEIGPWQLADGQLWFGLSFYDGEGISGVGGIGTFDFATRKYQIGYLKEIAGESAFVIRVEPQTIWLGLGVHPEGTDVGTGIAKISRADHAVVRYKAPGIVNSFVRVGDRLFAATTDGMMVFSDDGRVENIELSVNLDGSYSPVVKEASAVRD